LKLAKPQSEFLIIYWGPTWLSLSSSLAWAGYFIRIQAQDEVTAGTKIISKISSLGLTSGLWALIDQLPIPGQSLGGEITSDQADDYKSRLFATYQGLDGGYKREKSNPHREN